MAATANRPSRLPNLQGNVADPSRARAGPQEWFLGQMQGADAVTLLTSEMPAHNHILQ